jgi:hypothetical protein
MAKILFAFVTPRFAEAKENRSSLRKDYAMMKLYDDGKVSYRYYKKDDPKPELQNRSFVLKADEVQAFSSLLESKKSAILAYSKQNPVPLEAKKRLHSLLHAYGEAFLIPDYVLDLKSTLYLDRYSAFPNPDTLPYYEALRGFVSSLEGLASKHGITFLFQDHPETDYAHYRPAEHH